MVRGANVTIIESRPPWNRDDGVWTRRPVAQLRHDSHRRLRWPERSTRWHRVDAPASVKPEPLLEILDDPDRAPFWWRGVQLRTRAGPRPADHTGCLV